MWEMKDHRFDGLSAEQETVIRELAGTDPDLKEQASREKMVDVAIADAKAHGATFDVSEEELRKDALAFLESQMKGRLGT